MAKFGKYRSIQQLLEAKQGGGIVVKSTIENVIRNLKMMRRIGKKTKKEKEDFYNHHLDNELRHDLIGLNKVVKQLEKNQKDFN
jgi:hypothetical protein